MDICYTNHAEADQDDMDNLLTLLAAAGVTFIMGVPGADDVMLNYQSTSFHDALYVRDLLGSGGRRSSTRGSRAQALRTRISALPRARGSCPISPRG